MTTVVMEERGKEGGRTKIWGKSGHHYYCILSLHPLSHFLGAPYDSLG